MNTALGSVVDGSGHRFNKYSDAVRCILPHVTEIYDRDGELLLNAVFT